MVYKKQRLKFKDYPSFHLIMQIVFLIIFLETRYTIVVSNLNMYTLWTRKILQSQPVIIANNVCLATIYRKQVLLFPRENIFQRHCFEFYVYHKIAKRKHCKQFVLTDGLIYILYKDSFFSQILFKYNLYFQSRKEVQTSE